MSIPQKPDDSPTDESIPTQFNEATMNPPMLIMNEAEFLYASSALFNIPVIYNPATMNIAQTGEED